VLACGPVRPERPGYRSVVIGRERPVPHPLYPIRGTSWVESARRPTRRCHPARIPRHRGIPSRRGQTTGRPSDGRRSVHRPERRLSQPYWFSDRHGGAEKTALSLRHIRLRASRNSGEGRESRLHHPDDVNVDTTERMVPRGSAGLGQSHHLAPRPNCRAGVVEPPTSVLPCSAPWWATGPGRMRPPSCAGEERVRRMLMLCPRMGISVRRDAAT